MDRSSPCLTLADGSRWLFRGVDPPGRRGVEALASVASLDAGAEPGFLEVAVGRRTGPEHHSCSLPEPRDPVEALVLPLRILNVPARHAVMGGGAMLHTALLVHAGRGFLVAGPSGAGKSTAAARVPAPWEALGDEKALIVRDAAGRWVAHPWPTCGKLAEEGVGSWDVQRAVPVAGVFFLEQAAVDGTAPLGRGESLCLLNEVGEQAVWPLAEGMDRGRGRELRVRQFENLARLAADVACFRLRATLKGAFWEEIRRAVDAAGATEREAACALT